MLHVLVLVLSVHDSRWSSQPAKQAAKTQKKRQKKGRRGNFIRVEPVLLYAGIFRLHKYIHARIITEDYEVINVPHICTAV